MTPFMLIPLWGIEGSLFLLNTGLILIATITLAFYLSSDSIKRWLAPALGMSFVIIMAVMHPREKLLSLWQKITWSAQGWKDRETNHNCWIITKETFRP